MYKASDVMQKYGYNPKRLDLSRIENWDDFVRAMNYAMMKQFSALENGGRMAVLMGDIKKKGRLYSMLAEIVKPGTLENIIIKAQHNCFSDRTQYSGNFIPILHEYVMIVRKDSPVLIPILMTQSSTVDIRDMPGATWRDVIAAVWRHARSRWRFLFSMNRSNRIKRHSQTNGGKKRFAKRCRSIPCTSLTTGEACGH